MDARTMFERLRKSAVYEAVANEAAKFAIFKTFWEKDACELVRQFDKRGLRTTDAGLSVGFGYLVEGLARRSLYIPHNTPAGEHLATILLDQMHSGDQAFIDMPRRYNPDLIWVRCRGMHIDIVGIGEIKSSVAAYLDRQYNQIMYLEHNVREVIRHIEETKKMGVAHPFFSARKITIREPMEKYIIVPCGMETQLAPYLLAGWQSTEIEFSYAELVFIARSIWPEFRQDSASYQDERKARFEKNFLKPFLAWGTESLRFIYGMPEETFQRYPAHELFLFCAAIEKLPLDEAEIELASAFMRTCSGLIVDEAIVPLARADLSCGEERFFETFIHSFGASVCRDILVLLAYRRELQRRLEEWAGRYHHKRRIRRMADCDVTQFSR